ncbi:MAG: hypothetical protein ACRC30_16505 [Clostridium sp.]
MKKIDELKDRLKELKLEKRDLILANKKTDEIDKKIKVVQEEINNY